MASLIAHSLSRLTPLLAGLAISLPNSSLATEYQRDFNCPLGGCKVTCEQVGKHGKTRTRYYQARHVSMTILPSGVTVFDLSPSIGDKTSIITNSAHYYCQVDNQS